MQHQNVFDIFTTIDLTPGLLQVPFSPVSSWILLGSHLLPILMCCTAYPVEESAHCSFGQLSKLPVAVPKSAVQQVQRSLLMFERQWAVESPVDWFKHV